MCLVIGEVSVPPQWGSQASIPGEQNVPFSPPLPPPIPLPLKAGGGFSPEMFGIILYCTGYFEERNVVSG
jgi:hypothetical protein